MSDVLIKGMEMPKNCMECPIVVCLNTKDECPLAPVPPHGDLIDRDALPTSRVEWEDIVNAPTVIPAEEGEARQKPT